MPGDPRASRFLDAGQVGDPAHQPARPPLPAHHRGREVALQAGSGRQFAVLMLDLDHFKSINDQHGHEAGDRALQHVTSLLIQNTRGSDYLFRYGGEEFVLVPGPVSRAGALTTVQALRLAIADAPVVLAGGFRLPLPASTGAALQDGHPDYERVLARADAAMYQARRGGRNRVVVADGELPDPPGQRALQGWLHRAGTIGGPAPPVIRCPGPQTSPPRPNIPR